MLFKEIITVYTESYETNKYTLWANAELLNIKASGTHIVTIWL
jgi:hypothetical protein